MNLVQILESVSNDYLEKVAIIEEEDKVTYRELWDRVDRLARAFLDIGIKEGDRIAICLPNCQEYIFAFFAALKINAIAVPLTQVITSYELKTLLKDCQPSLLITDNVFLKRVLPFEPSVEAGKLVICSKNILRQGVSKRAIKIDDLLKKTSRLGTTFSADSNTVASINYTYRGYGYPLGAMLTHGNYKCGVDLCIPKVQEASSSHPRILLLLHMSHIFALVVSVIVPLCSGGTLSIPKYNLSLNNIFKYIESQKVNMTAVVPTLLYFLLRDYNYGRYKSQHSLSYAFCGGSPMALEIYQKSLNRLGINLLQGYGLTESLIVSTNTIHSNFPQTIGLVFSQLEVNIVDEVGNEVKVNEYGEIIVKGQAVMFGYYNHEKETKEVLRNDWCYTGDYGYLDEREHLYFSGLKKQIAKVGGNMVDLVEIANTINFFPGVISANIGAVSDEIWGQILTAEVLVKNPKEFDTKQLRSFLRDRLSSYKIPHLKIVN